MGVLMFSGQKCSNIQGFFLFFVFCFRYISAQPGITAQSVARLNADPSGHNVRVPAQPHNFSFYFFYLFIYFLFIYFF